MCIKPAPKARQGWTLLETMIAVGLFSLVGMALMGTGIATGEVVTGESSVRQTLVTGDAVNTAARLEQAANPGEILMARHVDS